MHEVQVIHSDYILNTKLHLAYALLKNKSPISNSAIVYDTFVKKTINNDINLYTICKFSQKKSITKEKSITN